jgi:hypothetical protein
MSADYRDTWVPIIEMWGVLTFIPVQYKTSYECWKEHPRALAVVNLKQLIQSKGAIQ